MVIPEFWMVWCEDGAPPTFKHPTEMSAKSEAERLARLAPGKRFCVMQFIAACVKSDVQWIEPSMNENGIPF